MYDPSAPKVWRKYSEKEMVLGTCIFGAGEKVTKARLNVLSALANIDHPISIKQLSQTKEVKAHNITTLYRTLETLAHAGLVRKVIVGGAEALYETAVGRRHHHHIVCTSCGTMEPIDVCPEPPSSKALAAKGFAAITDHSLEFFGLCKKCAPAA